jgi:rRNA-processing protein FCF1
MIQPQFHININKELEKILNRKIERIIISPIYEELQNLTKKKEIKETKNALMTLQLIENFEIVKVKRLQNETVDDLIIRLAKKWNSPVATNDKKLRRRLRSMNVAVIYLRQKSRLEVEGMMK